MTPNRRIAHVVPCQVPSTLTVQCGDVPAGFDLEQGIFLCASHLQERDEYAPTTDEEAAVAQALALLRANTDNRRRLREQQG